MVREPRPRRRRAAARFCPSRVTTTTRAQSFSSWLWVPPLWPRGHRGETAVDDGASTGGRYRRAPALSPNAARRRRGRGPPTAPPVAAPEGLGDGDLAEHVGQTGGVVGVAVREHEQVDASHAVGAAGRPPAARARRRSAQWVRRVSCSSAAAPSPTLSTVSVGPARAPPGAPAPQAAARQRPAARRPRPHGVGRRRGSRRGLHRQADKRRWARATGRRRTAPSSAE